MLLIEVVIGLVFIFSLLSILVTQINSFIANLLKWRSKQLKQGLITLLADQKLQAEVLAHPLINMVDKTEVALSSLRVSAQQAEQILDSDPNEVTYIDPKTFTEALMSILIVRAYQDLYVPLQQAIESLPNGPEKDQLRDLFIALQGDTSDAKLRQLRNLIVNMPNNEALLAAFMQTEAAYASIRYRSQELAPLMAGARNIENPAFSNALEVLLATAKNLDDARKKLETWFNDGMARTSELYQSRIQVVSFCVGLVLVILLNVDTLYIGRALWEDQELRQSVAAAAREYQPPEQTVPTPTPTPSLTPDAGEENTETPEGAEQLSEPTTTEIVAQLDASLTDIEKTIQELLELQLPVGWENTAITSDMIAASAALGLSDPRDNARNLWNFVPGNNPNWFALLFQKLLGWFTAAVAAAKGAPFWFDLLNKIARRGG